MTIAYYASNKWLDYFFGATAAAPLPLATIYMGLSTTSISPNGTGATEPAGGAYARIAIPNDKANGWNSSVSGALTNKDPITFVESSAAWGTITYVFIADALTAGNILYYQALSSSRVVQDQTVVQFAAGGLTISLT